MPLWIHFKPKQDGKGCEREKMKIIIPFLSYPTPNRKLSNKQLKNLKNKNIPLQCHFDPKQVGKAQERVKIKIIIPFRSYPKRDRKIHKNS